MGFEWFVGVRYLRASRRQFFISLITLISIAGVVVGVVALIVVLSVMNGFSHFLRDSIRGTDSHILVHWKGYGMSGYGKAMEEIAKEEHVVASSPVVMGFAMLRSSQGATGVVVRGVEMEKERKVTELQKYREKGRLSFETSETVEDNFWGGILLGAELADKLEVDVGNRVTLISSAMVKRGRREVPRTGDAVVTGIFRSGYYEYDSTIAYVSLASAQEIFGLGDTVTGLEVKLDDFYQASHVAGKIEQRLGLPAQTWMERHRSFFSALKLEKTVQFIVVLLIIIVAAFNIASTLMMVVMEKTKDIGILKSMGATGRSIGKIFVTEGVLVGTVGTVIGIIGGLLLANFLDTVLAFLSDIFHFQILDPQIYYLSKLPVKIEAMDIVIIAAASLTICFLCTLYPAWRASRLDPVEALRYE